MNAPRSDTRVLFVTTTPALHKAPSFRLLGEWANVLFIFFSRGSEPYMSASATPRYEGLRFVDVGSRGQSRAASIISLCRSVATADYDVMVKCINGKLELPLCYLLCRLRKKKFILWTGIWKWPDNRRHRLGRALVRHICRNADAVCTYGSHVSEFLALDGVPPDKLFVVPQPVQPGGTFHSGGRQGRSSSERLRLLFVGRLVEEKGLATLLRAARPLAASIVLTVVGEGRDAHQLKVAATRTGLDVSWLGQQDPRRLALLYRCSDCVVIPSVTTKMSREPWGFVANEAMLSGCTVVASTAVGAAAGGLVRHRQTGMVFAERDHIDLRRCLQQLCDDQAFGQSLARAGEQEARTYTDKAACTAFAAAIGSVTHKRPD